MHSLSTLRRRLQALLDGGALSRDEFETLDGLVGGAEHEARQRAGYDVLDRGIAPIIDVLVSLAALNFGRELPLTGEDERVDAIAAGVNMLAEELQSSVVSLDFVRDIIDSMAESLVVTDHDGIIQLVNESTGRLVERPLEALRGEHISCLGGHSETSASRLLADLEPAATAEAVVDYVDARGRRTPILLSVRRLCPRDDRPSLYVWVGKDIRARLQLERELREARDAAVASAAAKGEFLANMSHEIRTPMNAVIGLTGLLLETALDERQRGFVELVRTSGETLLALINDILDFSKIESGELELERAPMSVRDCVENALDVVTATAAAKSIELLARVDLDVPVAVYGDATRVQQTLVNLLGNAVKFTGRGEVMLSVGARALPGARGVELEWVVRDSGIGIPAHAVPRLFDAFSQAETSTTRRFGGTGLGLAICKRLVEGMGGRISVQSLEGEGTTFRVTIPGEVAPYPRPRYLAARDERLHGVRVLLVDDNHTNLEILRDYMESWGAEVIAASSGEEALARLEGRAASLELGIIDMDMDGMSGLELANALRRRPGGDAVPLIMLASLSRREAGRALEPFRALLTKPVKPGRLFSVLRSLVAPDEEPAESETETRSSSDAGVPLRVLLAEDNAINQTVAKLSLARLGLRADVVADGQEAIRAMRSIPYDLVLMDVQMPLVDGLEATRVIRADADATQPYIVAVTASATVRDRQACLDAGVNDYVSKPYRLGDLRRVVARCRSEVERRETVSALDSPRARSIPRERARSGEGSSRAEPSSGGAGVRLDSREVVLDRAKLTGLAEMLGTSDADEFAAFVDEFLLALTAVVDRVARAVEVKDAGELRVAAHSLKANAAQLGAMAVARVADELERHALVGAVERGAARLAALEEAHRRYRVALAELRAREGW